MALHFMSDKELTRLAILRDLAGGWITTSASEQLPCLDRGHVQRLFKAYQEPSMTTLMDGSRGQPSSRRTSQRRR
jgi:hypothetical protein